MHRWRAGGPWESRRWSLDCGGTDPQARGGGRRQEDGGTKHGHARGCRFGSEVIGRPPTREVSFPEKREARPGSRVRELSPSRLPRTVSLFLFLVSVFPPAQ